MSKQAKLAATTKAPSPQLAPTKTPPVAGWLTAGPSILHIDLWYDGIQSEMNLVGPNMIAGDFVELQYYYLRQYFRKVGEWMKLEAYQASICFPKEDGTLQAMATYEKVVFLAEDNFVPGQYFDPSDNRKGGPKQ